MKKQNIITPKVSEFELVVLQAIILLRDNAYGMTIQEEIKERTGRPISIGAVYTTLYRLENKGFVSSRKGDPTIERGGRAKMFYTIEGMGAQALNESIRILKAMNLIPQIN